jgi:hypothetical protein
MMKAQNETLRADRAMVAMLLGCGLRRSELLSITRKTSSSVKHHCQAVPQRELLRESYSFITFYFYVLSLEYPRCFSLQFDLIKIHGGTDEIF